MHLARFSTLFVVLLLFAGSAWAGREGYLTTVQKYRTLKTKIVNVETNINQLIIEKSETKDLEKKENMLREITETHKELTKLYGEFDELERELRFRYPEKNNEGDRHYRLFRLRSLQQMEADLGLDGKLDQLRAKVRAKYQSSQGPEEVKSEGHSSNRQEQGSFRLEK